MTSKPQSQEYKAFENILGKVLTVSKTELDRRMKEQKREPKVPASHVSAVSSAKVDQN
jgi:hypothetical protein